MLSCNICWGHDGHSSAQLSSGLWLRQWVISCSHYHTMDLNFFTQILPNKIQNHFLRGSRKIYEDWVLSSFLYQSDDLIN